MRNVIGILKHPAVEKKIKKEGKRFLKLRGLLSIIRQIYLKTCKLKKFLQGTEGTGTLSHCRVITMDRILGRFCP